MNQEKEAAEIAKYAAKDSDYLHDPEVFMVYYQSQQLIVYSGLFKEMAKKTKNLINIRN
ncbi:hypothetical protein [Salipaludibacillus keqinensis]|uniref:hypothetical protein n=1 Tax=Salipaludibacillus keqinensis TaxID=2045207 RepID=UPI001304B4BA|nr:hypothetical protein [Salipaludibacillus keqinensis]